MNIYYLIIVYYLLLFKYFFNEIITFYIFLTGPCA